MHIGCERTKARLISSVVQIVGALEMVWVLLVVMWAFNLDRGVVQSVRGSANQIGDLGKCLEGLLRDDVGRHGVLACTHLPDVYIVDVDNVVWVEAMDVFSQFFQVKAFR